MSYLVGISGARGSGKHSVCRALQTEFKSEIVSMEKFFSDRRVFRYGDIADWDRPEIIRYLSFRDVLSDLKQNKTTIFKPFSRKDERVSDEYTYKKKTNEYIKPTKIVFVEGSYIFYEEEIRNLIDLRIFWMFL